MPSDRIIEYIAMDMYKCDATHIGKGNSKGE